MQKTIDRLVVALRAFVASTGLTEVVLGLSGGVDSALVAKLAVLALGQEHVTALVLPFTGVTDPANVKDAEEWAAALGIACKTIPINGFAEPYAALPWKASLMATMNLKARLRATILYHHANTHGALVLGTGNKTEATLGYCTKYGDGACDVLPIGSLYKTEVWEAAKVLGLPRAIIEKTPTAELLPGQTDEGEIGMSYSEMDSILRRFEAGRAAATEPERALWDRMQKNRHKTALPPVL